MVWCGMVWELDIFETCLWDGVGFERVGYPKHGIWGGEGFSCIESIFRALGALGANT